MINLDTDIKEKLYAYLSELLSENRKQKIENLSKSRTHFIAPIIEDIYQFRNAGAIVRSMEAFSLQTLFALENKFNFIPEQKVSKGADKWIDIHHMPTGIESLTAIKNKGYELVAISPENNAIDIQDFNLTKPVAMIFGTEFEGVTQDTLDIADQCVKIPMLGFTESLNVSVAAGICFYEMRNKLENSTFDWKLSKEEELNLKIKWAVNSVSSGSEIAQYFINQNK